MKKEYEEICDDCLGVGKIRTKEYSFVICVNCKGTGKISWIDKIFKNKDIIIPKGYSLYCSNCGKKYTTTKVNIGKHYPICSSHYENVEYRDNIICRNCSKNLYSFFNKSSNWRKN